MLNTQGHNNLGDPTRSATRTPRRSVIVGSLSFLVAGIVLSVTALPAMANVVSPTTSLTTSSLVTTSTKPTAHPTVVTKPKSSAHHRTRVTTPRTAARHAHVATTSRPASSTKRVSSTASTTTTLQVPTTTVAPTPTTTVPVTTTTTAKSPPATRVPQSIPNPAANIAPNPNFLQTGHCTFANGVWGCDNPCVVGSATALSWPGFTNGAACTNYVLQAINNARADEGVRPMVLPNNWYSLTTAEQLFVVADLERTARGLPAYVGINSALSANAQHAAATDNDPSVAAGFPMGNDAQGSAGFGGAWSGGFDVLAADYVWMYDDAWSGSVAATSNVACTSAHAVGCWAHRDELLGSDPGYNPGVGLGCTTCEMGTGFAMVNGHASYADLIELPQGALPPMTFTWANNVLPNLS
jgi:hypothetical protein